MNSESSDWSVKSINDSEQPSIDLVNQWLRMHNGAVNPEFVALIQKNENQPRQLTLIANSGSTTLGGLLAQTQLTWLRISIMAVDPAWRSQGIGAALLAEAERQAIVRGCKYAYVDTMEYQAPGFYQKHGYRIAGQLPDWDSLGHSKFYLIKTLVESEVRRRA